MTATKEPKYSLVFAYGEPAVIIVTPRRRYLALGDLHIGRELKLASQGIKIYGTTEKMAERIDELMAYHKAKSLIILGDIKDSIMRPESTELKLLNSFFSRLSNYEITILQGNHDAGLGEIKDVKYKKEVVIGKVGLMHGNSLPSERLMKQDWIISGHEHPAAMTAPAEDGGHLEKAWVIMDVDYNAASKIYKKPNLSLRLVSMPAFSDLITGSDIESKRRTLNPAVRRGIFRASSATVYNVAGEPLRNGITIT